MGRKPTKILIGLGIIIFFFMGLMQSISYFFPHLIERWAHKRAFSEIGLPCQKLRYGKDFFEYVEGGEGETLLFVHGFQGEKAFWLRYIQHLFPRYHVVALDLPGHGGSSLPKSQKFDLYSLAQSVGQFVKQKNISSFHLVGCSLGGGVCTAYALAFPEHLKSLTLINPLGVAVSEKSDLQKKMEEGKNLFFPNTVQDLDELYLYLMGRELNMSYFFKKCLLSSLLRKRALYKRAFAEILQSKPVNEELTHIHIPTLLLAGSNDRIIPKTSFEEYANALPKSKLLFLENAAHVFVDQHLKKALHHLEEFWSSTGNKQN